mgnify:CR=1 FL=1
MYELSLGEKYTLSIKEAAVYFNIGIKKMRRLAEENMGDFALISGNRYLIIRTKFEEYLQENYPRRDNPDLHIEKDEEGKIKRIYNAGDVLVFKLGWVLIDSPGQGLGHHTCNPAKEMTKAQKEFLFDYYTKRNRSKEANALYQNENS